MSSTFTVPLPSSYSADGLDYTEAELDAITEGIKAAWGRDPLPRGGGFNLTMRVPGNGEVSDEVKQCVCGFFGLLLKDCGVLSERPACLAVTVEGGAAAAEVLIETGMLRLPDGGLIP